MATYAPTPVRKAPPTSQARSKCSRQTREATTMATVTTTATTMSVRSWAGNRSGSHFSPTTIDPRTRTKNSWVAWP